MSDIEDMPDEKQESYSNTNNNDEEEIACINTDQQWSYWDNTSQPEGENVQCTSIHTNEQQESERNISHTQDNQRLDENTENDIDPPSTYRDNINDIDTENNTQWSYWDNNCNKQRNKEDIFSPNNEWQTTYSTNSDKYLYRDNNCHRAENTNRPTLSLDSCHLFKRSFLTEVQIESVEEEIEFEMDLLRNIINTDIEAERNIVNDECNDTGQSREIDQSYYIREQNNDIQVCNQETEVNNRELDKTFDIKHNINFEIKQNSEIKHIDVEQNNNIQQSIETEQYHQLNINIHNSEIEKDNDFEIRNDIEQNDDIEVEHKETVQHNETEHQILTEQQNSDTIEQQIEHQQNSIEHQMEQNQDALEHQIEQHLQAMQQNNIYGRSFHRERHDTLESQASSLDFSDDEPSFAAYAQGLDDVEEDEELSSQEVNEQIEQKVIIKNVSFERVLADAIVHQVPLEELKNILAAGDSLINRSGKRPCPLHYTVWQKYPEAAVLLLRKGYDVNTIDDYGYSALHLAARHGYSDMIKLLIKHGSTINFNSDPGSDRFPIDARDEPLRLAVKHGHVEAVEILLENGANPNSRYFTGSEITLANPLQPDILALLLNFGAHVNDQDRKGLTPLMRACRLRQTMESIQLLLVYGGDVNIRADARHDYRTALHYAVLAGSHDIVSVLVSSGALINFEDSYDQPSPLHLAVRRGDLKMINLLLDLGAQVNSSTSLIGSVLHMACSEKVPKRLEVMELLLSRGADPNIIVLGLDGTPILPPLGDYLVAGYSHDSNVVKLLLKYGAEVIIRSPQTSPLGLLNCLTHLEDQPNILAEVLEGAQEFDVPLIRKTSLLGAEERKILLDVAESPFSLRHLSRITIRHTPNASSPDAVLKLNLPQLINKYLLYDIS